MNKKDQGQIKKAMKYCIEKIATCYVSSCDKQMLIQDPHVFAALNDEQYIVYTDIFKNALSGKLGSLGRDAVVSPAVSENVSVALSDKLATKEINQRLFEKIRDHCCSDEDYCILLAYGTCDVPSAKQNKGSDPDEEFNEVYSFIIASVIPCPFGKPELIFDMLANEIKDKSKTRNLGNPIFSILYPSFTDGHTDVDHAFYSAKSKKMFPVGASVLKEVFGADFPTTIECQQNGFRDMVVAAYGKTVPYEALTGLYERMEEMQIDAESRNEEISMTATELANMVISECGIEDKDIQENVMGMASDYRDCVFNFHNIVPKNITIESFEATVKLKISDMSAVNKRSIEGREYFLIPANGAYIEGIPLRNKTNQA